MHVNGIFAWYKGEIMWKTNFQKYVNVAVTLTLVFFVGGILAAILGSKLMQYAIFELRQASFICKSTFFHMKGSPSRLALKKKSEVIRKWPMEIPPGVSLVIQIRG